MSRYYHENEVQALVGSLIDHSDNEMLVTDAEGIIIHVNSKFVASHGGKKETYIGRNWLKLNEQRTYGEGKTRYFMTVVERGERVTENFSTLTPQGEIRYFTVDAVPLQGESGKIERIILKKIDKTEQVRLEKILTESQKLAAMGELSAYIAHEIRNPLFAIGGFAKKLWEDPSLDEQRRERAGIILEEARRLEHLCKSLLSFARPTKQDVLSVDVNAVAKQTVSVMQIGSSERRIKVGLELSDNPPKVYGNPELIQQCLVNLIKNAMEALCDGGTIRVRTRFAESMVYLEVEDDGPGIPLELQEEIFSPFFSTKEEGSGLGLALTRKIINECDGKLFLHSRPGSPTVVSLALQPVLAGGD